MIRRRSVVVAALGAALAFALPTAFAGSTADPGISATGIYFDTLTDQTGNSFYVTTYDNKTVQF